jgi:ribonuclease-3
MLAELEKKLSYTFQRKEILEEALTHPSFKAVSKDNFSYQRLEFLGDKVLGLIIGKYLFKHFKGENEGNISKRHAFLVCGKSLALVAKNIDLGKFIKLSQNQEIDGGRESENILENTMEALIGAIFLDSGLEQTEIFVLNIFKDLFQTVETFISQDSKSTLQEWFQKKYKKTPEYIQAEKFGNVFKVSLSIENQTFEGAGKTIKEAEKNAASKALEVLKK